MIRKQPQKSQLIFYIFISLFLGLFILLETVNQKLWTNDFRVYYGAVHDFFNGNSPYLTNYGLDTGFFKYPPFTLYLFGLLKILPYWAGQALHLTLSAIALMISLPLLKAVGEDHQINRKQTWILYLGFFSIAVHLARELHMGNVNLILLGLFSIGLYFINRKSAVTVICWSLMIILKPIMILTLVPLVVFNKWKLTAWIGLAGLFFFLFPVIHLGWNGSIGIWTGWYKSIAEHGNYIISSNSLRFLSGYYFGTVSEWMPSVIVLIILTGIMLYSRFKTNKQASTIEWVVIFTAFIPNFFVTDTQHFLLSVPLIIFSAQELSRQKSVVGWIVFGAGFVLFSLNSNDLLGKELANYLSDRGAVGVGNLLFIGLYIALIQRKKLQQ